jgi:acyl-CoA synthetase (AMP-forming)/AMP-acid ligase II
LSVDGDRGESRVLPVRQVSRKAPSRGDSGERRSQILALDQSIQSTCAWLHLHANQRPDAIAITNGQTGISYRDVACNVVRIMDALAAADIRPDLVIGVETADRLLHLLLLLACEALGVTTIALLPSEFGPPMNLGRLCDRILASHPLSGTDAAKTLVMTQEWVARTLQVSIGDRQLDVLKREPDPNGLVRLIKSSGTTGMPKVMGMTHQVWQRSIQTDLRFMLPKTGLHPRFLCLYQFSVRGCHRFAWVTLHLGGTIHFRNGDAAWGVIASGMVNFGLFITGDLEKLVHGAPSGAGPFDFHIDVIGSAVSARLRRETRRNLAESMLVTYSSNECAHVSVVDENNVGTLLPGVQVKICDTAGNPVPLGQSGLICIKCDTMVTGYIDEPELSRKTFIDGWFHTNDLGCQPSSKELVVLGRADEVLNIGGLKVSPSQIAEEIRAIDGILDAMVIRALNLSEISVLVVAVETGPGGGPDGLASLISPIIQRFASVYELLLLAVFPRTETGKIRKEAIQEAYQRALRAKKSSVACA